MRSKSQSRNGGFVTGLLAAAVLAAGMLGAGRSEQKPAGAVFEEIDLPRPQTQGKVSLETALAKRRSVRRFDQRSLTLAQIGQLMWAAQGITDPVRGLRTAPSAGATYPLELYLVTRDGHFHYVPRGHRLERLGRKDLRRAVSEAAVKQQWLADAAMLVVVAADFQRTSAKYGERARRYVHLEAGHAAQNLLLQATAMGLGAVPVGAFYDDRLKELLGMPGDHDPLYIIAVGYPR